MGEVEPDIFHTDAMGTRNRECLSLGCDNLALFQGRSPIQMYQDFIEAFVDTFSDMFGDPPPPHFPGDASWSCWRPARYGLDRENCNLGRSGLQNHSRCSAWNGVDGERGSDVNRA